MFRGGTHAVCRTGDRDQLGGRNGEPRGPGRGRTASKRFVAITFINMDILPAPKAKVVQH